MCGGMLLLSVVVVEEEVDVDFFFRRIILGARLGSGLVVVVDEASVPSLGVCGDASTVMVSFMLVGWREAAPHLSTTSPARSIIFA